MEHFERHDHDVLVIGAGGAGLRAAVEAEAQGASVGLVCKSLLGKAHTVMAEGGIAAALATVRTEDRWEVHFRDTMRGGKGVNDWRMARIHAQEAPERVRELEAWGALFDRTAEGRVLQRPFGGHTYARLAHVGDRTGLEMIRTLQDRSVHAGGVTVYMECTAIRLLKDGDRIAGAVAYWRESGRFVLFRANAVVLATGGGGKAWLVTSNSWEYTGDGHALAYQAGADLMGMEFVQFHPTGMVWPPSVRGTLVTEGVRGEGGVLLNAEGERFMFRYVPEPWKDDYAATEDEADRWVAGDRTKNRRPPELLTRDVVARAIVHEVAEGRGSPHGGALLDIARKRDADYIRRKLPSMYHQFRELADVDITREPMEVGPTTHYMMGGIKVDPETQASTVPGLFAAGEVAAGLHGANRLGGNSLSDLLVFGRRAGLGAAEFAAGCTGMPAVDDAEVERAIRKAVAPWETTSTPVAAGSGTEAAVGTSSAPKASADDGPGPQAPAVDEAAPATRVAGGSAPPATPVGEAAGGLPRENPFVIQDALRVLMQEKVGIARSKEGLESAIREIEALRERAQRAGVTGTREYNPGWHTWLDLESLLLVSEAVARAALERTESRGAHTRDDHPDTDPEWGQTNVLVRLVRGAMETAREPVPRPAPELQRIIDDGVPQPPPARRSIDEGVPSA